MSSKNYHRILDEHLIVLVSQGNHEAYQKLRKRYQRHALALAHQLITNHQKAGLSVQDIATICDHYFPIAVVRYDPTQCSFYHYWREMTSHYVLNYIIETCYSDDESLYKLLLSLDEQIDEKHSFGDILAEKDDTSGLKVIVDAICDLIERHSEMFEKNELSLLKLMLEGYTIGELEHTGMMAKSTLYITFNIVVRKIQNLMGNMITNNI